MTDRSTARRVILHAGLHKTGTTSLQAALAQGGAFAYPGTSAFGPGHAVLAWHAVGHRAITADPLALVRAVRAVEGSMGPVVLSSEEFLGMIRGGPSAAAVQHLADEFPTELVLTLRPDVDRLRSFAAERILQGDHLDMDRYWEVPLRHLSFDPGLLGRFLDLADWAHVHAVIVDPAHPERLLRSFEEILGTAIRHQEPLNEGSSSARLAVLNDLNRGPAQLELQQARGLSLQVDDRLAALMPGVGAHGLGPPPDPVRRDLEARWDQTCDMLRSSARAGTLTVHGDLPERDDAAPGLPVTRPGRRPSAPIGALVLHAGLPKTGSSALQVFLARNAEPLHRLGLHYPATGAFEVGRGGRVGTGNGIDLAVAALRLQRGEDAAGRAGAALADAVAAIAADGSDVDGAACTLVSSELLAQLDVQGLAIIRAGLAPVAEELRAVVVLRDPVELTGATYVQHLRRGERRGLMQWWEEEGRDVIRHRLECPLRLAEALGDDAVTVVAYRDPSMDATSIIRPVLAAAVRVEEETLEAFLSAPDVELPQGHLNASPGPLGREALRASNAAGIPSEVIRRLDERLVDAMPSHHRPRPVVEEHLATWIRRLAEPVLARVADRFEPDLADLLAQERPAAGASWDDAAAALQAVVDELAVALGRRREGVDG